MKKTNCTNYVKPSACYIKVSPTTILAGSGTEGYNEKPGEGSWHSMKEDDSNEE